MFTKMFNLSTKCMICPLKCKLFAIKHTILTNIRCVWCEKSESLQLTASWDFLPHSLAIITVVMSKSSQLPILCILHKTPGQTCFRLENLIKRTQRDKQWSAGGLSSKSFKSTSSTSWCHWSGRHFDFLSHFRSFNQDIL